jgi:hypothetical protein
MIYLQNGDLFNFKIPLDYFNLTLIDVKFMSVVTINHLLYGKTQHKNTIIQIHKFSFNNNEIFSSPIMNDGIILSTNNLILTIT